MPDRDRTGRTKKTELDLPRLELSGVQVAASAAASLTAAVIASFFGVTGTIVGTVVVSVVATTGSALYNVSLRRTHRRLQQSRARRLAQQERAGWPVTGTGPVSARPDARPDSTTPASSQPPSHYVSRHRSGAGRDQERSPAPRSWRTRLARRRLPLVAGALLALVAVAAIVTVIELIGRRPIAAMVGASRDRSGTTFLGGTSSKSKAPVVTTTTTAGASTPSTTIGASTTTVTASPSTTTPTTVAPTTTTVVPVTTTLVPVTTTTVGSPVSGGSSAVGGSSVSGGASAG